MKQQRVLDILAVLLTTMVLHSTGCATSTPAVTGLPTTVLLHDANGHMTVRGEINDQPLLLVIDTGAKGCSLTPEAARRAGISTEGGRPLYTRDITGERRFTPTVNVAELRLPVRTDAAAGAVVTSRPTQQVAVFRNVSVKVIDSPVLVDNGYDGVIGLPILERAIFRFDPVQGELNIRGGRLSRTSSIALDRNREGIYVPVETSAGREKALLDTGYRDALGVSSAGGRRIGYTDPPRVVNISSGLIARYEIEAARLNGDVWVGPIRLVQPIVSILPPAWTDDLVLGAKAFHSTLWELDVTGRRMRILSAPEPDIRPKRLWVRGFTFNSEDRRVTWVLPGGSAAVAGIQIGDEVVSIDGGTTKPNFAVEKPDADFEVVIRRGSQELKLTIRLTHAL